MTRAARRGVVALLALGLAACAAPGPEEPIELHFRGAHLPALSAADYAALLHEELDLDEQASTNGVEADAWFTDSVRVEDGQTVQSVWAARVRSAERHAPIHGPGPDEPSPRHAREEARERDEWEREERVPTLPVVPRPWRPERRPEVPERDAAP